MHTPTRAETRFSQRRVWASRQVISFLMQQGVENPDCISLAAGLVDPATLPAAITREAVDGLLARETTARQALQYGTTPGAEPVRETILGHFARLEGSPPERLGVSVDNVVLTTGSQQLLSIVGEVLLDPGDVCLVAAPTYFVFLGTLAGLGVRCVSVPADEHGMDVDALEAELERLEAAGDLPRVKLIYLVSDYENPSGALLSEDRRRRAVEIARRWSKSHRLFVLEDRAYRELRYDGPEPPSVWSFDHDREFVIAAHTFSKSFSPGIRVGYGVVPDELVEPICDRKGNEDFGSSNFGQQVVAQVIRSGAYTDHVAHVRASYHVKRDAMLRALETHFADLPGVSWITPHGGLYVWASFPADVDTGFDGELFHRATRVDGVMYVPGEICFADDPSERPANHARLSFGVQDPAGIDEGVRRLANAFRAVTLERPK